MRPRSVPQNQFRFGNQEVRTKVYMMVPRDVPAEYVDVVSGSWNPRANCEQHQMLQTTPTIQ